MVIDTKIIKIGQVRTISWEIYFWLADNRRHFENGHHLEFGPNTN
jgi:hypothetical protein